MKNVFFMGLAVCLLTVTAHAASLSKSERKTVCKSIRASIPTSRTAKGVSQKECLKFEFDVLSEEGGVKTIDVAGGLRDDNSRVFSCSVTLKDSKVELEDCEIY